MFFQHYLMHDVSYSYLQESWFHYACIDSKNMTIRFTRRTDVMPPAPEETKFHPSAVDLLLIKRLITETTKVNLTQFLQHEFTNIGKAYAERLIGMVSSRDVGTNVYDCEHHVHDILCRSFPQGKWAPTFHQRCLLSP